MVYNPLNEPITRTINVPLYYTGLSTKAIVKEKDGPPKVYDLNRKYEIQLSISIPANSYNWFVIE